MANDYNLACHLLNVACCSDEHFDDDHGDYNLSYNFDIYGDPLSSVGDDFLKDSTKGSDNRVPHIPYKHSLDVTCTKDKNILDLNKNKKDQAKNVNYKYTNKKNKKQKSDKNNSQIHDSKKDETQGKVRFLSHDSDSELKDDRNKKFEKIAFQSLNISSETFMRMVGYIFYALVFKDYFLISMYHQTIILYNHLKLVLIGSENVISTTTIWCS